MDIWFILALLVLTLIDTRFPIIAAMVWAVAVLIGCAFSWKIALEVWIIFSFVRWMLE